MTHATTNHTINGAADLYEQMLEIKNGRADGGSRGCTWITKKQARALGIEWSFVESATNLLGLQINRDGRMGYQISK
jgi:hypothetical protein